MAQKNAVFCSVLIVLLCVSLLGCSAKTPEPTRTETKYVTRTVTVNVPVMQIPAIKPIPRPTLQLKTLNEQSSYADTVAAYYNSIQQLIRYSGLLEKALSPFYNEYGKQTTTTN